MRLIDVDAIDINEECTFSGKGIKAFLDSIPTAYDVDKVVERLESMQDITGWDLLTVQECLKIVKSGGIE